MTNLINKTFVVHNIPDYNTLVALIREMNGYVVRVSTSSGDIDDSEVIRIEAEGDENHLLFAEYLYKKYKTKIDEMRKKLPVDV